MIIFIPISLINATVFYKLIYKKILETHVFKINIKLYV